MSDHKDFIKHIENTFIELLSGIAIYENNKIKTTFNRCVVLISFPTLSPNEVIIQYNRSLGIKIIDKILIKENEIYGDYTAYDSITNVQTEKGIHHNFVQIDVWEYTNVIGDRKRTERYLLSPNLTTIQNELNNFNYKLQSIGYTDD